MLNTSHAESLAPEDLVEVGYVSGAYGIRGWVRIKPYSADAQALLKVKDWWLDKPGLREVSVRQVKEHSGDVVVQFMGIEERNLAEALKGAVVSIERSRFPSLPKDEFYWVDLIGLDVENMQGESLGAVREMIDNGAHPILVVQGVVPEGAKPAPDVLIPFVEQFIGTVDLAGKKITVDWGIDY